MQKYTISPGMAGSDKYTLNKIFTNILRDNKMNKTTKLLLIPILFLFGCEQGIDISNPPPETGHQYKLIKLPRPKNLSVEDLHTESKDINGDYGGWFSEGFSYYGGPSGTVSFLSTLHFYAGSFSGTETITQTFNTETAAITFGPSMQFNVPVYYTLTITGLDLTGVDPTTLDFVFIDANGNMYPCEKESVTMDASTGMLKVKNAHLNHFSRYGFVN